MNISPYMPSLSIESNTLSNQIHTGLDYLRQSAAMGSFVGQPNDFDDGKTTSDGRFLA